MLRVTNSSQTNMFILEKQLQKKLESFSTTKFFSYKFTSFLLFHAHFTVPYRNLMTL